MASFTDDFNRTASTLGAGWTNVGGFVGSGDIATDGARADFPAGAGAYWIYGTALDSADHYSEAKMYQPSGNQQWVAVRGDGTNTFYYGGYDAAGGSYMIRKCAAGTLSLLASVSGSDPNGSAVRLEIVADALELFIGGVSTLTTTDSSITSGTRAGLNAYDGREADDWAAADIGGGGGGLSIPIAMHHYKQMMGAN